MSIAGPVLHRTVKLLPDHTFVAYAEQLGSMSEVLDGTWVLSNIERFREP